VAIKKVVFLGSKPVGYECFKLLIAVQDALNIAIVGLLTQARKEFEGAHDLTALAAQNGIPVLTQMGDIPPCDIIYSVQYHQLLQAQHIGQASQAAVNLHMAPLPEYRGSNQFSQAIIDGKDEFGTTIHMMTTGMDSGDILFQKRFPIPDGCWVHELYDITVATSIRLFAQTLKHIVAGTYTPVPQQNLVPKYGTSKHYKHEIATLKQIDLSWDKERIERHIRATSMPGFENPYCTINGEKLYFKRG
jgi:methionyl-tRNA formyltransferase